MYELRRIGGISPTFRHICSHAVLVKGIGCSADVLFPDDGLAVFVIHPLPAVIP